MQVANALTTPEHRFQMCQVKSEFEADMVDEELPMLHFTSPALLAATARMLRVFGADVLVKLLDPQGLGNTLREATVLLAPMAFVSLYGIKAVNNSPDG